MLRATWVSSSTSALASGRSTGQILRRYKLPACCTKTIRQLSWTGTGSTIIASTHKYLLPGQGGRIYNGEALQKFSGLLLEGFTFVRRNHLYHKRSVNGLNQAAQRGQHRRLIRWLVAQVKRSG